MRNLRYWVYTGTVSMYIRNSSVRHHMTTSVSAMVLTTISDVDIRAVVVNVIFIEVVELVVTVDGRFDKLFVVTRCLVFRQFATEERVGVSSMHMRRVAQRGAEAQTLQSSKASCKRRGDHVMPVESRKCPTISTRRRLRHFALQIVHVVLEVFVVQVRLVVFVDVEVACRRSEADILILIVFIKVVFKEFDGGFDFSAFGGVDGGFACFSASLLGLTFATTFVGSSLQT